MNDESRKYFVAAGRSLGIIEAVIRQRRECNDRRTAFSARVGAQSLVRIGEDVVAVIFPDGNAPKGWLAFKHHPGSHYPSRATKAGKALAEEMRLTLAWDSLARAGKSHIEGRYLYHCVVEKVGDVFVISQHKDAVDPLDAKPIRHSDYWRMKEEDAAERERAE